MIFQSGFTDLQVLLLLIAGLTFLAGLLYQIRGKEYLSMGFLLFTALLIFCSAALLDPFLNLWDERFHALVAKNLMNHPLRPTLYDDPIVNMPYYRWDRYIVWLHKQPLFLWQIALSFKLFGVSEFTLRLPDVVMGTILVFAGYRTGKLLVNQRVGFIAGAMIISSGYLVDLVAGRQELDHNDFSFLFYVSMSIWAWTEYIFSRKKYWIVLIGCFSGFAILCKWLAGLLIYLGWLTWNLQQTKSRMTRFRELLVALLISIVIALPWQVFMFCTYPSEAIETYRLNATHFLSPVDGQNGSVWYHFEKFGIIYGVVSSFLIIPGFCILRKTIIEKSLFIPLVSMVLAVYLFFTIAATKMVSYTALVIMIMFLALASLYEFIFRWLSELFNNPVWKNSAYCAGVMGMVIIQFNLGYLQARHTENAQDPYFRNLLHNREVFRSLELPPNSVLFNVKGRHYVEAMFYTGLPAYPFIPTCDQCQELKRKGRVIAVFKTPSMKIPTCMTLDPTLIIIDQKISGE